MMEPQVLAEKVVDRMMTHDAFSQWLGIRVEEVAPRRCVVSMTVRAEMLNGFAVCHGGVTFSLADSALAFATNTEGRVSVSIENSMAYPAKVVEGDVLTAVAEELSTSNRIATYQVIVTKADDTRVGLFRGTVYRTEKAHFPT